MACGLDFSTVPSFDDHRVGVHDYTFAEGLHREPPVFDGRRCLDADEMEKAEWRQDRYGRWASPTKHLALERIEL